MTEVADLLLNNGVTSCWVGARDLFSSDIVTWVWSGSSISVSMWGPSEPDHWAGDCVQLDAGSNTLSVQECDISQGFLCEFYYS